MFDPFRPEGPDARLIAHPALGGPALRTLRAGPPVAIAGAGTIGARLAMALAALGVPVVLLDRGTVEAANVGLQPYERRDLGMRKTEALRRRLLAVRPELDVACRHGDVRRLGPRVLAGCRLLVLALDSFSDRVFLAGMAAGLGLPVLDVALDGTGQTLIGRVAGFDPASGGSCLTCGWDDLTWAEVSGEAGGAGCAALAAERPEAPATLALPGLADVVAGIAAVQVARLLLGTERGRVVDRECRIDLGTGRYRETVLTRDGRCRSPHSRWVVHELDQTAEIVTIQRMLMRSEEDLGPGVRLSAHADELVLESACPTCGRTMAAVRLRSALPPCPECGGRPVPLSHSVRASIGRADAPISLDLTWADLGLPPGGAVHARGTDGAEIVYLFAL